MFYVAALYQHCEADLAFDLLKRVIPSIKQAEQQGQLPVLFTQLLSRCLSPIPALAGRSSHLFNTELQPGFITALSRLVRFCMATPVGFCTATIAR